MSYESELYISTQEIKIICNVVTTDNNTVMFISTDKVNGT